MIGRGEPKRCPTATSSTINSLWIALELKPDICRTKTFKLCVAMKIARPNYIEDKERYWVMLRQPANDDTSHRKKMAFETEHRRTDFEHIIRQFNTNCGT